MNDNNDYFKYVDLPPIPENLLLTDIYSIERSENLFRIKDYRFYGIYGIGDKLTEYLKGIFSFDFFAGYQIVRDGIHIHKDGSRTECFNYLIDNGGRDNTLNIYHEDKKTILHSGTVDIHKWHWINVGMFHNVTNLSRPRFGITVTPK